MIVIVLERVQPSLRGELTRWLQEIHPTVFVGAVSARVRDTLWELVCHKMKTGAATMAFSTNNEQGYEFRFWANTTYYPELNEGLWLIRVPDRDVRNKETK